MLRGALIPSFYVGILALIIATAIKGQSGLFGALLAQIVVLVFFLVSVMVAFITKNANPMATMALALFSYFAKILILGALMFLIGKYTSDKNINRISFGISAIVLTFAWLGGEIRAFLKLKLHLPLPENK